MAQVCVCVCMRACVHVCMGVRMLGGHDCQCYICWVSSDMQEVLLGTENSHSYGGLEGALCVYQASDD